MMKYFTKNGTQLIVLIGCIVVLLIKEASGQVIVNSDMTTTVATALPEHYGINFQRGMAGFVAEDPAYQARVNELGAKIVRYHAAEQIIDGNSKSWVDYTNRKWDSTRVARVLNQKPIGATVLITITGWPTWMRDPADSRRLHPDSLQVYADFCGELVDLVNNKLGQGIVYWEPFNEKDRAGYDGPSDMVDLANIYKACRLSMLQADPTIKMVAAAFREPFQTNIDNFLAELSPGEMDVFSFHQYGGGSETDTTAVYNRADNFVGGVSSARSKLNNAGFTNIPIWMNEWNIYLTFSADQTLRFMRSEIGGVFDALAYKYTIEAGQVDAMFSWNAADGTYGKIRDNFSRLNPAGHIMSLYNKYGVGEVKASTTTDDTKVLGYTVQQPSGEAMFSLINRSETAQNVNFIAGGWEPANPSVIKHTINKSGLTVDTVQWSAVTQSPVSMGTNEVVIISTQSGGSITNQLPVADAGINQILSVPYDSTTLKGSGQDNDGTIVSYSWAQTGGPSLTLANTNNSTLQVDGLLPDQIYRFQLTITDNEGGIGIDDIEIYTYSFLPNTFINSTSVEDNFSGTTISNEAITIRKDGRASHVQNDELTISLNELRQFEKLYRLTINNQAGLDLTNNANVDFKMSSNVPITLRIKLFDANNQQIDNGSYTAFVPGDNTYNRYQYDFSPVLAGIDGTKVNEIQLMQISSANTTGTILLDDFRVGNVDTTGLGSPPTLVVEADRVYTIPRDTITIRSESNDVDGTIIAYAWEKISGPSMTTIVDETDPTLTLVNTAEGDYIFKLTVTDNDGFTASDQVAIRLVNNNGSMFTSFNFLVNEYFGNVVSDAVQNTGANLPITRVQSDGLLSLTFTGLDQFEKPYLFNLKDGYTIDLSENSIFELIAKSDVAVRLRVKLIDEDGQQVDNFYFDFDLPGDSTFRSFTKDFSGKFGNVDPKRIKGLELMSVTNNSLSGTIVLDELRLGAVEDIVVPPTVVLDMDRVFTLPVDTISLASESKDLDGPIVSYSWEKVSGPSATLVGATEPLLNIINMMSGDYTFQLTVTDQDSLTATDQINIRVSQNNGAVKTVSDFLSNDFSGTVISDSVQTTSANLPLTRIQDNGELSISFDGLDQFEKPYILTIRDGYSLDLSQNSTLTFRAKSDVEIRLRAKLLDLENRQVDNFAFDIVIAGDNTFRTYTKDFAGRFGNVDPATIKTLELMSSRSGPFTGTLVLDNLNLGNKPPVLVTGLAVLQDSLELLPGSSFQLQADIAPDNADEPGIIWSSSDERVATVSASGLVTTLLEGSVIITATTVDGGFKDTVSVTVDDPNLNTSIITPVEDAYVRGGANASNNYNTAILRAKDSDPDFDRISLLKFVATDIQNLVEARLRVYLTQTQSNSAASTAVFEITDNNWREETVTWSDGIQNATGALLDVATVQQTDIYYEYDVTEYLINAGRDTLSFSLEDSPRSNLTIDFSSKENTNGKTPELLIFTSATGIIPVTALAISADEVTLDKGSSAVIAATVGPSNATNKTLSWISNDPSIVSVDSLGQIFGVNLGTTDVIAIANGGNVSDTITVTVVPAIPTKTLTLNPLEDVYVRGGNSTNINYGSDPELLVKNDNSLSFRRLSYLKFDISGLDTVRSAKLRVHGFISQQGTTGEVRVLSAATDDWSENTMTYTTRRQAGDELDVSTITTTEQYYEWDVTDFLRAEVLNDTLASFIMIAQTQGPFFSFKSKETTTPFLPELVVVTNGDIIPVTGINLPQDSLELTFGNTDTLIPTILPDSATDKNIFWVSSDPSVVTVDPLGGITATGVGQAYVTVLTNDGGYTDSVYVTVPVSSLILTSFCSFSPDSLRLWRVRNQNAFDVNYTWEIYGTGQTGSGVASSGDSFFTSDTEGSNTLKLYWSDALGIQRSTVKASIGGTSDPTVPLLNSSGNPTNPRLLLDRDKHRQSDSTHHIKLRGFNQEARIVVISESPVVGIPSDGLQYNFDLHVGLGDTLAAGEYVVQNNTKSYNDFTLQGLKGNTTYYVAVFIYDNGTTCGPNYLETPLATGTFTTKPVSSSSARKSEDLPVVEVEEIGNSLFLYPNPAKHEAVLKISTASAGRALVSVISSTGQVSTRESLTLEKGTSEVLLDLSGLRAGMYLVIVESDNQIHTKNLLISH
ncbi:MAG: DNRLRE domain-containing protein [Bacteroidota bacterium]